MSARDAGEAAAFSKLANYLGSEFVKASGDGAELKSALQASEAKAKALQDELDALKTDHGFTPVPGKPDQFTDRDGKLWYCGPEIQPMNDPSRQAQSLMNDEINNLNALHQWQGQ